MIVWSFWVDWWEHPFNRARSNKSFFSKSVLLAVLPEEKVKPDLGPWTGPPPGPIKPGIPKWTPEELAAMAERRQWMKDNEPAEYWWNDPDQYEKYHSKEYDRDREENREQPERDYPDPDDEPDEYGQMRYPDRYTWDQYASD